MTYLKLSAVRKQFGDAVALESLSLSVPRGEFLSMLGPSGCGKTTALRIIAGFEYATSGSVTIDGEDVTNTPAYRRDLGMMFQAYSLFPNMSAAENVEFGLRVRKVARRERSRRVEELLELVGLGHAASRYPYQLSGGMQQRIALARALAIEPRVLLLDEPLAALDAKVRVQLREEIRRIQARVGITMVYVTHDQEEALSISDWVVVMSAGRIEQIGSPAEIYENPQTPFVADFIGAANRFEASVVGGSVGAVECESVELKVDAATDYGGGERVLVVVRPELCRIEPSGAATGSLAGKVVSTTFMGASTRVTLMTPVGELSAEMPSAERDYWQVGREGVFSFPPDAAKLLPVNAAPTTVPA